MSVSSRDDYTPGDVRVRLTFPSTNNPSGGQETRIRVEDSVSGTLLIELQLEGDQLAQLLGQRQVYVPAARTEMGDLTHVGKYMHTFSRIVWRGDIDGQDESVRANELASELAEQGWQVSVRRVRDGMDVVGHRWEDTPELDDAG